MTKRLYTAEKVLEAVLEDVDDDPDEPVMEGSDDEFSDLECLNVATRLLTGMRRNRPHLLLCSRLGG